jgi:hypothetical protein
VYDECGRVPTGQEGLLGELAATLVESWKIRMATSAQADTAKIDA